MRESVRIPTHKMLALIKERQPTWLGITTVETDTRAFRFLHKIFMSKSLCT